eukprot:m.468592 g.468592  ORF g.468592 m.468592 type:complete len:584 (+) comp21643_c0_seq1:193-1944(+)
MNQFGPFHQSSFRQTSHNKYYYSVPSVQNSVLLLPKMSCVTPIRNRGGNCHTPPRPEKRVNLRKRIMSYSNENRGTSLPPLSFCEATGEWVTAVNDGAHAREPLAKFSILSFNVWFVDKHKELRCLALIDIIYEHDPIVCCLQEVTCDFLKVLKNDKRIQHRYNLSHPSMETWDGYGVAFLIRRGHQCTSIKQYELPTDMGRVFITVNLTIANERLEVSTVHLESLDANSARRALQLGIIQKVLGVSDFPALDQHMEPGNNPSSLASMAGSSSFSRFAALQQPTTQLPNFQITRPTSASDVPSELSLTRRTTAVRPFQVDRDANDDQPLGYKHARGDGKRRLPTSALARTSCSTAKSEVWCGANAEGGSPHVTSTEPPHMLIFAGDFNFDAGTVEEDTLHRSWRDTWEEGGDERDIGSGCTVDSHLNHMLRNSSKRRSSGPRRYRFDRILYRPPSTTTSSDSGKHHQPPAGPVPVPAATAASPRASSAPPTSTWKCQGCRVVGRTPLRLNPMSPPLSGSLSASKIEAPTFAANSSDMEDAGECDDTIDIHADQVFPSDHFGLVASFSRVACKDTSASGLPGTT